MKIAKSFNVQIWVGLRVGYTDVVHDISEVYIICQKICDEVGYCFTITPTYFTYKNGSEPGAVIGLIDYPRFEMDEGSIFQTAKNLATILKDFLGQNRVTITCPDWTYMIGDES